MFNQPFFPTGVISFIFADSKIHRIAASTSARSMSNQRSRIQNGCSRHKLGRPMSRLPALAQDSCYFCAKGP